MPRLREMMAHGAIALLASVFALAFAAFSLATALAREVVSVLQQQTFDEESGDSLSFTIDGTSISYSEVLYYAIALVLVVFGLYCSWLLTRRTGRVCPECRSHVPAAATVCRFCTSELEPLETDA
jgi:large conductance mechanosensitive channel